MSADLHLHSSYSDGTDSPAELIDIALINNLDIIALTDHDTVAGLEETITIGRKKGIEVIPAIELSTFQGKAEIHILGYFIDYGSKNLLNRIDEIFNSRITRAEDMVKKLNEIGIKITFDDVKSLAGDDYIGRPHIAMAIVKAGYIDKKEDAFTDDFIGNGGKAYVPKYQLSPCQAIELINEAGGVAVVAHPFFINKGKPLSREVLQEFKGWGLAGIEVYHSKHNEKTSQYYMKLARELDLLVTGGSDYHGKNSPGLEMGDVRIDNELVERLRE